MQFKNQRSVEAGAKRQGTRRLAAFTVAGLLGLVAISSGLAACGQRGPLYLPTAASAPSALNPANPAAAASAPAVKR
jgi:predicted small lipoprotein YifL